MLVSGKWQPQADGITRPVLRVGLRRADGSWWDADFIVDSGADQTILDDSTVKALGIVPTLSGTTLIGVVGPVVGLEVATAVRLTRADGGQFITVNGPFSVAPSSVGLDMNLLGRDVLNLFAVILDRAGDAVWLVRPAHRYVIV